MKRLILCADDYALAPGVSAAIRQLAAAKALNATSVMAPGPRLDDEARALLAVAPPGFQIGLHLTLTGGLKPLTDGFGGQFPTLPALMLRSLTGLLDINAVEQEIAAQLAAFRRAFSRPPDFLDGHQHVHVLPGIRERVLRLMRDQMPQGWLRQCRGPHGAGKGLKGKIIAALSGSLVQQARAAGIATNPAFSGAYSFAQSGRFAEIFPTFLRDLPDGALVMCHPGHVDAELKAVDPVWTPREDEAAFLASDACRLALEAAGFSLY